MRKVGGFDADDAVGELEDENDSVCFSMGSSRNGGLKRPTWQEARNMRSFTQRQWPAEQVRRRRSGLATKLCEHAVSAVESRRDSEMSMLECPLHDAHARFIVYQKALQQYVRAGAFCGPVLKDIEEEYSARCDPDPPPNVYIYLYVGALMQSMLSIGSRRSPARGTRSLA
jgi:hypothetical protein